MDASFPGICINHTWQSPKIESSSLNSVTTDLLSDIEMFYVNLASAWMRSRSVVHVWQSEQKHTSFQDIK